MECTNFKTYCKQARGRFKNGYWANFAKIKEEKLSDARNDGISEEAIIFSLSKMAQCEVKKQTFGETQDDELYDKVVKILKSDEIVVNPIQKLINLNYYNTLNENEKQTYVLGLSQKFSDMRDRFFKESNF